MHPALRVFLRSVLFLLLAVGGLLLGAAGALLIPAVQTVAVRELARRVSQKLNYPIAIERVSIKWFDSMVLEGVSLRDRLNRPMIRVERLEVDYDLWNLIDKSDREIHLDDVLVYQPDVRLTKNIRTGDLNIDEFMARLNEVLSDPAHPGLPNQNIPFTIERSTVVDGIFTYDDPREAPQNNLQRFDYNHFTLEKINGNVRQFLALGDTIALDVTALKAVDRNSRLRVHQLDTRFLYCATAMQLNDLDARINNSVIRDRILFQYRKPSAFGDFNQQVVMRGRLRDCRVASADLGFFSDYLRALTERWTLSGDFAGTVDNFSLRNTDLRFGSGGRSRLAGDLGFRGLPETAGLTVDLSFRPSVVNMADIRQYYPNPGFNETIQKLGTVAFDARFAGQFDNFRTGGTFRTALGNVFGTLALNMVPAEPIYAADLRAERFALGKLLNQPDVEQLDGQARVQGRGLVLDRASLDVDGTLTRFGFRGYDYRNVRVQGNLQKAYFRGSVNLRDPNLVADLDGECDLGSAVHHYDLRGAVQRADLRALGLLRDSLLIRTQLDVQLDGNTLDQLVGTARFLKSEVGFGNRQLTIDSLALLSAIGPTGSLTAGSANERVLDIDSDFGTAHVQGNFVPGRAINDLLSLIDEYKLYFSGDMASRQLYYALKRTRRTNQYQESLLKRPGYSRDKGSLILRPQPDTTRQFIERYSIDYQVRARNLQPLLAIVAPDVLIAPGSRVDGQLRVDNTTLFTAMMQTDSVQVGNVAFGPSEVDLTTSKFTFGEDVLASAIVSSQRQRLLPDMVTENIQVEAAWNVDHIDFTSNIEQPGQPGPAGGDRTYTNQAALNGALRFRGDSLDLTFRRSTLRVLDSTWAVSPAGLIRKVGQTYTFRDVSLANQNQHIRLAGQIAEDSLQTLRAETQNFRLESLNPLLNTQLGGLLNGVASVRGLYQTPIIESKLSIGNLTYDRMLVGDVRVAGQFDPQTRRVNIDAHVSRPINRSATAPLNPLQTVDLLALTGTYAPRQTTSPFDLRATFTDTDLRLIEPLTDGLFTNMGGVANGTLRITGSPETPLITGVLDIRRGRLTIDYLKADVAFDDKVYVGEGEIIARRLTLRDPLGNVATVRGGVFHDNFRYFQLRFDADLKDFRLMNTTAKDNNLFYGAAVVTGKAELAGPIDNLTIRADLASRRGTRIFIPLDGAASVSSNEFIEFVNRKPGQNGMPGAGVPGAVSAVAVSAQTDPDTPARPGAAVDLSGIKMDFNFDITPDAYCEIQLDRQTGDIIKSNGAGRIAMRVDTKGDFTMTGDYEIQQGEYTFTFENVINKRFQIQPNSHITWTGDPYRALLDVTAAYTQYTSLKPLTTSYIAGNTGATNTPDDNRRFPIDLLIKLNGELGSPSVAYDLKVKEYPASSQYRQAVSAFESRIQSNEQEMTRQVSGVLLFNQLLPEGSGLFQQDQVSTGLYNSVSELLSNQISRLASNLDEKLDVGVSFGGFTAGSTNENLLNNLQLRFSYRFLNDRFRISRDGGFTYGQNQYGQTQTSAASLLGEWTLEYWITPDGRFRAKMYNRNQQSALAQANTYNSGITTGGGISFLYTRSFNRLFGGLRRPTPGYQPPAEPEPTTGEGTASIDENQK